MIRSIDFDSIVRDAVLSLCEKYRYSLARTWSDGQRVVAWIMLNPSTADSVRDDPTIRKAIQFSHRLGYDGMIAVNLFAFRATKPAALWAAKNPVGPRADQFIRKCNGLDVIAAWGAHGAKHPARYQKILSLLPQSRIFCLGTTASGQPKHPLYLPYSTSLTPFLFARP